MQRHLDVKFLLVLLGVAAVFGLGTHLLHGWQVKRGASFLLRQADRAKDAKEPDKELGYLARYLAYAPDDNDTRVRYGLALQKRGRGNDVLQAFLVLEQALRHLPDRDDVRRWLARIAVQIERFDDGREHLKKFGPPAAFKDGELHDLFGQCEEGLGKYQSAARHYKKATRFPPRPLESYLRLANLYRTGRAKPLAEDRAPDPADKVINALVADKRSAAAYLARARYLRQRSAQEESPDAVRGVSPEAQFALLLAVGPSPLRALPWLALKTADSPRLRRAEQDLAEARRLAPNDLDVLLAAAEMAEARGWFSAARQFAQRCRKLGPERPRPYLFLAGLEASLGRRAKGIRWLRRGLELQPEQPDLLYALADFLIEDGQPVAARKVLARLHDRGMHPAPVLLLEARIHSAKQEWLEAIRLLEEVRPVLTRSPDLGRTVSLLLGHCYEQIGDADQQYSAYRQAGADPNHPSWLAGREGMGRALVGMNKIDEALELYRPLMARVPHTRLIVARLLIAQNLGRPKAQRRWDEVDRLLEISARSAPNSLQVTLLRAQVLVAQDRLELTNDFLLQARNERPERSEYWLALAELAFHQRQQAKALEILDEAEKKLGDRFDLRLARARYWGQRGGEQAPGALARLLRNTGRFTPEKRRRLQREVADAYARAGVLGAAKRIYSRLAEEQRHDLGVKIALFDLAARQGDLATMKRLAASLHSLEGEEGTLWRYAQAGELIVRARQHGNDKAALAEARSLLGRVAARRPTWFRVPALQAQIDEMEKNGTAAAAQYLRAIDLGERSPAVIQRAIQLLYANEKYTEAATLVRKLPEQVDALTDLKNVVIDLSLRNREFDRAHALARAAVEANPKDFRAHLWLAQVRWMIDRSSPEVEPGIRRAVALAGGAPEPRVVLIEYLAGMDQKGKTARALAAAERVLSRRKHTLALARCYAIAGRLDRAKQLYQEQLRLRPRDARLLAAAAGFSLRLGETGQATAYLQRVVLLKSQAPQEADAARRLLWILKAAGGDYARSQKALADLGFGDVSGKQASKDESVEDLRAKALALAVQGYRNGRREAVRLLEIVRTRHLLGPEEQFLLAQLYESLGDWPRARAGLAGLLARDPHNLRYLAQHARNLLRHKETEEAASWLAQMKRLPEEIRQNGFALPEIEARVLAAKGEDKEAASVLQRYAQDKEDRLMQAAALLDHLAQTRAREKGGDASILEARAEQAYQRLVSQSRKPEATGLLLARFLARRRRLADALDLCDKAWAKVAPEVVAQFSVLVLYEGAANNKQCERVARSLEAALRKKPESSPLLTHLAAVRNRQGRFEDVVKTYRQILWLEERNATALNNLAFLLVWQKGKAKEALALIDRAIEIRGPRPTYLDTRALVALALGKTEQAVKDLQQVVAEDPSASSYFHLARALEMQKRRAEARAALAKAKDSKLAEADLHPLERPGYRLLVAALSSR
jgi:tetratricopeptide (TPR) repeat protein